MSSVNGRHQQDPMVVECGDLQITGHLLLAPWPALFVSLTEGAAACRTRVGPKRARFCPAAAIG
jgi:hypothetical protein